MVDGGDAAAVPLTGLTGALNSSLGSSGTLEPRRGAHFGIPTPPVGTS